jgi:two-component system NtrC family sensor kinase
LAIAAFLSHHQQLSNISGSMHRYLLFLFLLLSIETFAQQNKLDSLVKANTEYIKENEKKIQLLNSLAEAYQWMQLDSGIMYADFAIALATELNNQKELAAAYNNKAVLLFNLGRHEEEEDVLQKALTTNAAINNNDGLAENNLNLGYLRTGDERKNFFEKSLDLFTKTKNSNGIARANIGLGYYYRDKDLKLSLQYLNEALQTFKQNGNEVWVAQSLLSIGITYYYLSTSENSIDYTEQALHIALEIKNQLLLANCFSTLGNNYASLSIFPLAIKNYLNSLKISERLGTKSNQAKVLAGIGAINFKIKDYPNALLYLQKGLALANEVDNKEYRIFDNTYIGNVYLSLGKFNEALIHYKIALQVSEESKNEFRMSEILCSLAEVYEILNDYSKAFEFLKKSISLSQKLNHINQLAQSYMIMAKTVKNSPEQILINEGIISSKRNQTVIGNLLKGMAISKVIDDMDNQRNALFELSEVYEETGDTKKSFDYYRQYVLFKDSIVNTENSNSIANMQIQYETEKKEQEIILLNKDKALQQTEIEKQKTTRNSFIGGIVLVLLITAVTYNRYRVKQKANNLISKTLAELKNTQQQLIEQEKLAALGKLTSDTAQEIESPLNHLNNFATLNTELFHKLSLEQNEEVLIGMLDNLKINLQRINECGKNADAVIKKVLMTARNVGK